MKKIQRLPNNVVGRTSMASLQIILIVQILIQVTLSISAHRLFQDSEEFSSIQDVSSLYRPQTLSRHRRSAGSTKHSANQQVLQSVDACQSKMEIITPYYATNSKGKIRTVVNSELMQQAIQVETCARDPQTNQNAAKCNAQLNCGCEQKYKWHRLLVLDPKDSSISKGLFMDWFLFPSNCVCRCRPSLPLATLSNQSRPPITRLHTNIKGAAS